MGFEPTQAKSMVSAVNRFNLSATLPNQSSFNGKLNRNKKKMKQICFTSNSNFFCSKQKNGQIKPFFDQKKT